jgi:putative hemolysin
MRDAPIRLILLGLLILVSAFFSGSETALFSMSRAKRQKLAATGDPTSRLILRLLAKPRRLIATILVGNELVNISAGAVAAGLGEQTLGQFGRTVAEVLTTLLLLPFVLLVGEITPKSIAVKASEGWARFAARPIALFAWVCAPLRWLVRGVSEVLLLLLGSRPPQRDEGLKEEEFRALVDVGSEEGELAQTERQLIHNVFEFGDKTVAQVMTPAGKLFALSYDLPMARLVDEVVRQRFSRIPVYRGRRDNIVGVLLAKDLVGYARGQWRGARTLGDLLRPPFYVPKTTKLDRLFRQMQRRKTHMALVVDEYGRTIGVVTMEDLLEELFGAIAEPTGVPARLSVDGGIVVPPAGEGGEATTPPVAGPPAVPGNGSSDRGGGAA